MSRPYNRYYKMSYYQLLKYRCSEILYSTKSRRKMIKMINFDKIFSLFDKNFIKLFKILLKILSKINEK